MASDTAGEAGKPRAKDKGAPPKPADPAPGAAAPEMPAPPADAKRKPHPKPPRQAGMAGHGGKVGKEARVAMKLRVPKDLRKAFRKAAAARELKRGALFAQIFAEWRSRNPD